MASLGRLVKVEREIWIYNNSEEKLIEEIKIDVCVDQLKDILFPYEHNDDPLFYHEYILNPDQLDFFINKCNINIIPNFELHEYILVAHGVYQKE